MAKVNFIFFVALFFIPACSENKPENSPATGPESFGLPHARYFVVDSQAYSMVGNQIIHKQSPVYTCDEPIITAEYDPESRLLAILGKRHVALIDPLTWTRRDQSPLNGQAVHLKARNGNVMVMTETDITILSVYRVLDNQLSRISEIQKHHIRDFASNRSQLGMMADDSLFLMDQEMHLLSSRPFDKGVAMALSDSLLYAKEPNAIWVFPVQKNQLNEGTLFY